MADVAKATVTGIQVRGRLLRERAFVLTGMTRLDRATGAAPNATQQLAPGMQKPR